MFKIRLGSLICAGGLILASCFMSHAVNAAEPFSLTSSAFKDNGELAKKNACDFKKNPNCVGQNVSPPFAWSNPPAGTKSYAFVMFDPEGHEGLTFIHWVAYGIPASVTSFAEGEVSKLNDKYVGGKNGIGIGHYFGPGTPPHTDWHHYFFMIIATDLDPKALPSGLTYDELRAKLQGHAKGAASLIARFKHPT
jgi:Raf kinase inhibitor-like YbhB/YbcL family protein